MANLLNPAEHVTAKLTDEGAFTTVEVSCKTPYVKEIENYFVSQYKEAPIPGFRANSATPEAIKMHYGAEIKHNTSAQLIQEAIHTVLKNLGLEAGARPTLVQNDAQKTKKVLGDFRLDGTFTFKVRVPKAPQVGVVDFSGFTIITDKQQVERVCQEQLEELARGLTEFNEVDEPYTTTGNKRLVAKVDAYENNQFVPEYSVDRFPYAENSRQLEALSPLVREKIINQSKGDSFEIDTEDLKIKIEILSVEAGQVPVIDDEMAKRLGFESLSDLEKQVKVEWMQRFSHMARSDLHNQVRQQLVTRNPFNVPDEWVDEYVQSFNESQAANSVPDEEKRSIATLMAASDYLIELIAQQNPSLELTEDDIQTYAQIDAMASNLTGDQFLSALINARTLSAWKQDTQKIKVLDHVLSISEKKDRADLDVEEPAATL